MQLSLFTGTPFPAPETDLWTAEFYDCSSVNITKEWRTDVDAALVPVMFCERYGCIAGSSADTLGKMYIYDVWQLEATSVPGPRFLISNAVWRTEPPLLEAIKVRLNTLDLLLKSRSQDSPSISSVMIECATLGYWQGYSQAEQKEGIRAVKTAIRRLWGC